MLKYLRSLGWINRPVRALFKSLFLALPAWARRQIIPRWRVSGTVKLEVEDIQLRYFSKADDGIVDAFFYGSSAYEKTELSLFLAFARQSGKILDIGANTGLYSITSALGQPQCKIWAFEPYPVNADRFAHNTGLNKLQNVSLERMALGAGEASISFTVPANGRICDVSSANTEFTRKFYQENLSYDEIQVPQTSLDAFLSQHEMDAREIDLVKIDVESYELEVFKGALNFLEKSKAVIFCEIFVDDERASFFQETIKTAGYYCYLILGEGLVRVDSLIQNPDCRNYLFSKFLSPEPYLSFQDKDQWVPDLMSRTS